MLYITSVVLTYLITGSLYHLTAVIQVSFPPPPCISFNCNLISPRKHFEIVSYACWPFTIPFQWRACLFFAHFPVGLFEFFSIKLFAYLGSKFFTGYKYQQYFSQCVACFLSGIFINRSFNCNEAVFINLFYYTGIFNIVWKTSSYISCILTLYYSILSLNDIKALFFIFKMHMGFTFVCFYEIQLQFNIFCMDKQLSYNSIYLIWNIFSIYCHERKT